MENNIEYIFKKRKAAPIGNYLKSAVAIMLVEEKDGRSIVFEERAHFLKKQPGDICLPGGKIEKDETPSGAVIREISEELGIEDNNIKIYGEMDYYISPYNSIIYTFVASLEKVEMSPNKDEVDHTFTVPIDFFMKTEPTLYELEIGPYLNEDFPYQLIKGGKNYKFHHGVMM
jgi:8-oxo-dGTP pyrophosphatase MutT (NUDIX family)